MVGAIGNVPIHLINMNLDAAIPRVLAKLVQLPTIERALDRQTARQQHPFRSALGPGTKVLAALHRMSSAGKDGESPDNACGSGGPGCPIAATPTGRL